MELYNILVVDDEVSNLSALKRTLRHEYNVFTATNGEDALSIMGQKDIALVIADYRMPGMTGIEFLEKALQRYPDTTRIILTAYTDEKLLMDSINTVRVHGYLAKPWEPEEIKSIVREGVEAYKALCAQKPQKKTIAEILLERGIVTRTQLNMAMRFQGTGRRLGEELAALGIISGDEFETALELQLAEMLVDLGYADEEDIFSCYALQLGIAYALLSQIPTRPEIAKLLPLKLAYKYAIVPIDTVDRALVVAAPEPLSDEVRSEIEKELGRKIVVVYNSNGNIKASPKEHHSVVCMS
jgi:CheY-like chemotaxis protein